MPFPRVYSGLIACLLLVLTTPAVSQASVVYEFFDYGPTIQNLFQLSGTITVSNSAANDGVLDLAEIEGLDITVSDPGSTAGWTNVLANLTFEVFLNVRIDNSKIYLEPAPTFGGPGGGQLILIFGGADQTLFWSSDYTPFVPSGPRFGYEGRGNGSTYWSYIERNTQRDHFLIAEVQSFSSAVPEPATMLIWSACGMGLFGCCLLRRRLLP